MKLLFISILALLMFCIGGNAQSLADFKVEIINKQVGDFQLDSIKLSTPLDYYLSRAQVRLSGKHKDWQYISTTMFDYSGDEPDEIVDETLRNYILNERIDYIVTYRDSVASVVTHNAGEDVIFFE